METVDLLLKQGLITQEQINKAKDESARTGLRLEKALEKLGFISEEDVAKVKADHLGVPYMDLADYIVDAQVAKIIPEEVLKKHRAVPIFKIADCITVAMVNPNDIRVLDEMRKISGIDNVEPVLVSDSGIQRVLDSLHGSAKSVEEFVKIIEKDEKNTEGDVKSADSESPVIKLVNTLISEGIRDRASDIHIEPEQDVLRVRYRIDGILHETHTLPTKLNNAIVSRIKIMSNLDIAESRKPQDGKVRLKLENKSIDIRVSTFPTVYGENVVLRLLDKASILLSLKDLGFSNDNFAMFDKIIRRPNGIILVTGPTGSGKTTTLYAALTNISSMEKNIITIEDPVEYEIPLIRQTQVNPKAGITFANGLRSILRQDPDVVMVGEIRDKETAEIAIQASLTGHLVFSTLHTNDAPSALTRLIDMGIEPFLISSSIIGVLAQRLVRKICDKCKEKYTPSDKLPEGLGFEGSVELYRGEGCPACRNTGFIGRIGIFELLIIDENIRRMVEEKSPADKIKKRAIESGLKTLLFDGVDKARSGLTTIDEVLRVTETQ
ncbi:MAG: type II/IV secretion system protein [Candidatus Omnitrophota bacterium]|jgi:type IV pilus assembly protein PilB|nr:MAG: type II/IV secretion system protein [Candidatus Omnitrophota bacterium]